MLSQYLKFTLSDANLMPLPLIREPIDINLHVIIRIQRNWAANYIFSKIEIQLDCDSKLMTLGTMKIYFYHLIKASNIKNNFGHIQWTDIYDVQVIGERGEGDKAWTWDIYLVKARFLLTRRAPGLTLSSFLKKWLV